MLLAVILFARRTAGRHHAAPRSLVKHQISIETSVLWVHDLTEFLVQSTMKNGSERWFEFAVQLACGVFERVKCLTRAKAGLTDRHFSYIYGF
jgi:hypothetical protein